MLLEMHENTVFSLVNMEKEAFEQTILLQKDEDGGFLKIPVIGTVAYNFIKGYKILQPNSLTYFKVFTYLMLYKEHLFSGEVEMAGFDLRSSYLVPHRCYVWHYLEINS